MEEGNPKEPLREGFTYESPTTEKGEYVFRFYSPDSPTGWVYTKCKLSGVNEVLDKVYGEDRALHVVDDAWVVDLRDSEK